jgi:hypothetical protein
MNIRLPLRTTSPRSSSPSAPGHRGDRRLWSLPSRFYVVAALVVLAGLAATALTLRAEDADACAPACFEAYARCTDPHPAACKMARATCEDSCARDEAGGRVVANGSAP